MSVKNLSTVRKGDKGQQVKALQIILEGLTVDGIFGDKTEQAVIAYQKKNGLSVDGIVGVNTWKKLLTETPNYLELISKYGKIVFDKIVEIGCTHSSQANSYETIKSKRTTDCATSVSAALQLAGLLPIGKKISHTAAIGKNITVNKNTISKSIKGFDNLISGTYTVHRIGKIYSNMDSKYKVPGVVYVQDSNICLSCGNGKIYSCNNGPSQMKNNRYVKVLRTGGYPFTSPILYAIVPNSN